VKRTYLTFAMVAAVCVLGLRPNKAWALACEFKCNTTVSCSTSCTLWGDPTTCGDAGLDCEEQWQPGCRWREDYRWTFKKKLAYVYAGSCYYQYVESVVEVNCQGEQRCDTAWDIRAEECGQEEWEYPTYCPA
jgi:hypothetical protein